VLVSKPPTANVVAMPEETAVQVVPPSLLFCSR
jgi:hypothetical protein